MANLSDYLTQAGISQRDFAERIGVDKGTVSRLVAAKMTPSLALAAKIETATDGAIVAISWVGDECHPPAHAHAPTPEQGQVIPTPADVATQQRGRDA